MFLSYCSWGPPSSPQAGRVVSFRLQMLYNPGKNPQCSLAWWTSSVEVKNMRSYMSTHWNVFMTYLIEHRDSFAMTIFHSSIRGFATLLQFRNPFYTVGRTSWTGNEPVARPLPTHGTTQIHAVEWYLNYRSQRSSERKQFMPYTTWPPRSATFTFTLCIFVWSISAGPEAKPSLCLLHQVMMLN
jgi:hypothetical protein